MITNKDIEAYIESNSSPEDELLADLNRETFLKVLNPRMLSGHPQGLLLEIISKMMAPDSILEIGTYTGYSAICLAKGLNKGGQLHTIESNDEIIRFPKKYFKKAGLEEIITLHCGNALEIIPDLNKTFDLVFIDADKQQYLEYFELCISKVRAGGIILVDNVLWDGKVLSNNNETDADTLSIIAFNTAIRNDSRVDVIMLPIRDGISIIRKR